jgi:hypothetical protein
MCATAKCAQLPGPSLTLSQTSAKRPRLKERLLSLSVTLCLSLCTLDSANCMAQMANSKATPPPAQSRRLRLRPAPRRGPAERADLYRTRLRDLIKGLWSAILPFYIAYLSGTRAETRHCGVCAGEIESMRGQKDRAVLSGIWIT